MSIHIGLMIWKEMKQQNMSSNTLADILNISKTRAHDLVNQASIDTELLIKISEALNYNFLQYYHDSETFHKLEEQDKKQSEAEISRLKALLTEKNKIIDLKDQFIKTQSHVISLLEKSQYR